MLMPQYAAASGARIRRGQYGNFNVDMPQPAESRAGLQRTILLFHAPNIAHETLKVITGTMGHSTYTYLPIIV